MSASFVPEGNAYMVTGELSRGNELPNAPLDSSRSLEHFEEKIR